MMSNEQQSPAAGVFPSSDHFPLGRAYGAVDSVIEPPSPVRPFGLTLAVARKAVTTVNHTEISYDEDKQIGLICVGRSRHAPVPGMGAEGVRRAADGGR